MGDIFSWPQVVGYIALVTYVLAYTFRTDNGIKIGFSVSNIFWIVHYYFINAQTAALTTAIITIRNLLSLNAETIPAKRKMLIAAGVSVLLIIAGLATWAGPVSIIPVVATIAATYGFLYVHGMRLRKFFLLLDAAWLLHAVLVSSIGGLIYATGALLVNGYMIVKITRENAANKETIGTL